MILITGGLGFIGLHTARSLLDAGETVLLTQYRARRQPDFIREEIGRRVLIESLDITDGDAVLDLARRHRITGVVHLAVPPLAGLSPADDYRVNTLGLLNVLEAARLAEVRRLTLASSVGVYASVTAGPFLEDTPLHMESGNPTEAFKKAFEILGLHYAARTGLDVVALRIAGIYGPLYHSMANLPSRLCHAAVQGREPDLAGGRGGVPYEDDASDICYVKDCGRAIGLAQMAGRLQHRTYNVGCGNGTRNRELVAAVKAAVPDARISILPGSGPQARPEPYMDIARLVTDTGFEPQYGVDRAIADYVAWLRHNPE